MALDDKSLVMTNIAMVFSMAHRNRWFTELRNGDFPRRIVSHNQMVVGIPPVQNGV
jgi:hypothetical protein